MKCLGEGERLEYCHGKEKVSPHIQDMVEMTELVEAAVYGQGVEHIVGERQRRRMEAHTVSIGMIATEGMAIESESHSMKEVDMGQHLLVQAFVVKLGYKSTAN